MGANPVKQIIDTLNGELDDVGLKIETHSRRSSLSLARLGEKLNKFAGAVAEACKYASPDASRGVLESAREYMSILEEVSEVQALITDDTARVTSIVTRALGLLVTLSIIEEYEQKNGMDLD